MTNFPDIEAHRWNAYFNACKRMETSGGGFAASIAEAYYKADKSNKTILESAFKDLFFKHMDAYERAWFGK